MTARGVKAVFGVAVFSGGLRPALSTRVSVSSSSSCMRACNCSSFCLIVCVALRLLRFVVALCLETCVV